MLGNRKTLLLASCGAVALAAPVMAQDERRDDIIIVTAQNRAQDVQDVPIVMDVISGDDLANAGFSDANDLGKVAPVAQIAQDQGTVRITIRGIGTQDGNQTNDTSVVTSIDGEYLNRGNAIASALFDIERVEVLRGPQGTLYGRNATAGAVNFIMRKPGDQLEANASMSYGNYDAVRADAGVTIPLGIPGSGIRVAGFYEDRDGYVSHPGRPAGGPPGPFRFPGYEAFRSDDNHAYGGRASLLLDDLSGFTIYAAVEAANRTFTPQIYAYADAHQPAFNPGSNCQNPGWERAAPLITNQTLCIPSSVTYGDQITRDNYAAPYNGQGIQYQNTWATRGRLEYEFGPEATLSYIAGYRYFEVEPGSTGSLPVVYGNLNFDNRAKTQSHELRLAGDLGFVNYQIGAFYFDERLRNIGAFYLGDITPGSTNFGFFINYNTRNQDSESKSVFGQFEFPLGDTLTAVGGLRYTENQRDAVWVNKRPGPPLTGPYYRDPFNNPGIFTAPILLHSDDSKVTWLAGLNYEPDADTLFYGKVSTGFKGGGFDQVGQFEPETNTAYEVGTKMAWGDQGQHIFNLGAFYYDYRNLQVNVLLNSAEGGRTFNAGKAVNWGVEAEAVFELSERDTFSLSVNYLNAEFKDLRTLFNVYCVPTTEGGVGNCKTPGGEDLTAVGDLDPNTAGIQSPNYAGNTPSYSPEWVIAAGYDHEFDLGNAGTLTFRANSTFKSSFYTGIYNYAIERQGAFTQTDLQLEWESRSGVSVAGFVRNLENHRILSYGTFLAAGPDDIFNFQYSSPRLYGVRVGFEY